MNIWTETSKTLGPKQCCANSVPHPHKWITRCTSSTCPRLLLPCTSSLPSVFNDLQDMTCLSSTSPENFLTFLLGSLQTATQQYLPHMHPPSGPAPPTWPHEGPAGLMGGNMGGGTGGLMPAKVHTSTAKANGSPVSFGETNKRASRKRD